MAEDFPWVPMENPLPCCSFVEGLGDAGAGVGYYTINYSLKTGAVCTDNAANF